MSDTTIIYYTDNILEPDFEKIVQDYLIQAANGKTIVSVSQKPMKFGNNICVGDIGRSHHSMFTQLLAGAKAATTKNIALAEHDCLYTQEHFDWVPLKPDCFYYNRYHCFAQWGGDASGRYSKISRRALSMLISNRELFIEAIEEKLRVLNTGADLRRGVLGACEPGLLPNHEAFTGYTLSSEDKVFRFEDFRTSIPNIDIRHGKNFSGGRKGSRRTYSIPYWGSFHAVMGEIPPGRWYQEATINGYVMPTRRGKDTNQKRWDRYIKPHLHDVQSGVFVELGCNAGFYCRKAVDMGFTAIGVEKHPDPLRHAAYWETCDPKGVTIVNSNITEYDIPDADVVLISNVHYWLTPHELKGVERTLRGRARRVIVMARREMDEVHKSSPGHANLKLVFKNWAAGSLIKRAKHYSTTFVNPLIGKPVLVNVEEIFPRQQLVRSRFYKAFSLFVETGDHREYEEYLKWRGFPLTAIERHKKLINDIKINGIKKPLVMKGERVVDGDHRLIIAKTLGIEQVPCLL